MGKKGLGRLAELPPFADEAHGLVHAIIETPKGSPAKLRYDPGLGLFRLSRVLPLGFSFPFDFGFIPGTAQEDGDPLDVLVLLTGATVHGCLLEARPIGVVQLEKEGQRNDRLVAVWPGDVMYGKLEDFSELPTQAQIDIERFFRLYPVVRGERIEYLGCEGAAKALRLVKKHRRPGRPGIKGGEDGRAQAEAPASP